MSTTDESVARVRQHHPDGEDGIVAVLEIRFDRTHVFRSTCIIRSSRPAEEQLDVFLGEFRESAMQQLALWKEISA